jgi:hypothetical protein
VELIAVAGMIAMTLLFYSIFKPVNSSLSLLAASFNLVGLLFEAIRLSPLGVEIAIVFTAVYCLLIGFLMFRSTFLPRMLSALMAVAGLSWLPFVSPLLANDLFPYNLACGILGEGSVCLWVLVMRVNVQRWNEQPSTRARW